MSRRIDIELTSTRDDGTWTWRAAGARQPKGVVEATLLYEGARVGDVVRAEADFEIEGITILSVVPPREKRSETARLEVVGPPRDLPPVTSSLVPRRDRDSDRRGSRGDDRSGRPGRPPRDRPAGERGDRPGRDRESRPPRERADRPPRERAERGERTPRPESRGPRPPRPAPEPKPKERRLNPGSAHRTAAMDLLPPEQRPIAEQVLRGGIPAVRSALEAEQAKAKEEGRPEVNSAAILAIAEDLLPKMKAAEWHDRADAASRAVDEISLRDLRAVVAGADAAARDDETRGLASSLREALERRVSSQREQWTAEITECLDENRLVRALRVAARPPDPASRFPSELATRLSDAAGAAMAPDTPPERWATVLDAVAASPVRRSVKPVGLPTEPGEDLLKVARQQSGRVPALAAMLGIDMPPPPGPPRGARPQHGRDRRPPRGGGGPSGAPRPPAAPEADTAMPAPTPTPTPEAVAEGPMPAPATPAPLEPVPVLDAAAVAPPAEEPATEPEAAVPVAQDTTGAHDVREGDEPTTVGALASPDPAEEARAQAQDDAAPSPLAADVAPAQVSEHGTEPAPAATVPTQEADAPRPPAAPVLNEPDSPAEAVAAQLLREQPGDAAPEPAQDAPGA